MNNFGSKYSYEVSNENAGARLDVFVARRIPGVTRTASARLISDGSVTVNGKTAGKSYIVEYGDLVSVMVQPIEPPEAAPEAIPLDIVYEDGEVLVVNKVRGMVVHPAAGNHSGTLVNALLHHCGDSLSGIGGVARPGIVHRIDKDTSGLLMIAKTDAAHMSLSKQLEEHSIVRLYDGIAIGIFKSDEGTVDAPIGRSEKDRKKMAVTSKNGKRALTHYKVIERLRGYTRLEFALKTGRTHQIRVHMAHLGHPLYGDGVYGKGGDGQYLVAKKIGFMHPVTNKYMEFCIELPRYYTEFIDKGRLNE